MLLWLMNIGFAGGGTVVEPPVIVTETRPGGDYVPRPYNVMDYWKPTLWPWPESPTPPVSATEPVPVMATETVTVSRATAQAMAGVLNPLQPPPQVTKGVDMAALQAAAFNQRILTDDEEILMLIGVLE